MPETPPGGYLFRLQDVEKQRERRKTKAKKAERRKKKKLGNMKNPTNLWVSFWPFLTIKTGENEIFWIEGTHQVGSPPPYIYIYMFFSFLGRNYLGCLVFSPTFRRGQTILGNFEGESFR